MFTLLFVIMMCAVFGNLFVFAIKAAWGIGKLIFMFAVLPLVIIGLFIAGIIKIVIPVLIILGVISLFRGVVADN